jgi:hypothetical protein
MNALFDYSFTSFVTPKIIKVLYVLATIAVSLWTLALVLAGFNAGSGAGLFMLVIGGPLLFLLGMVYSRVLLELVIIFFRINGNVQDLRDGRTGPSTPGSGPSAGDALVAAPAAAPAAPAAETTVTPPVAEPEPPAALEAGSTRCEHCGAEKPPGTTFCQSCGRA